MKCEGQKVQINTSSFLESNDDLDYQDPNRFLYSYSQPRKRLTPRSKIQNFRPLTLTTLSDREVHPINVVKEAIQSKEAIRYSHHKTPFRPISFPLFEKPFKSPARQHPNQSARVEEFKTDFNVAKKRNSGAIIREYKLQVSGGDKAKGMNS